jgi:glycosyltransferase involved in cell wall biosynthesis
MTASRVTGAGSILLEAHDLTLPTGTGIATYARVLDEALRTLGYQTEALIGAARGFDRKDPTLSEIAFYDAERAPNFAQTLAAKWRSLSVNPLGAKPFPMPRTGVVIGAPTERLKSFAKVHVVPHLPDRERNFFKCYRAPLRIKVEPAPKLFHATRPAPLRVKGCPNIFTIHDLVPLRLPFATADDKKYHLGLIRHLCRSADHIVTVSEHSRQDIIRLTGISESRITNTYQSVSLPERLTGRDEDAVAREIEALFGLGFGEYFLFVGAIEPKKNLSRLVDAFAASGASRPLLIVGGPGWMSEADLRKIDNEQFLAYEFKDNFIKPRRRVQRLPYVAFDHLVSLIRGARALLFPSLYEGFGLPVLEAMALGTPVMTSNVSSLPELCGAAALLVDPYDINKMAAVIRAFDSDQDLRSEYAARGRVRAQEFSSERYLERIGELYRRVI